ncbi:MAG: QacE family quaternary ammonium compound efflux SMR transporter [Propionibacterium sp.]|nr:QacE family quaternary ammonium compound efflux SMR transporter [Propionibacterium sp.]
MKKWILLVAAIVGEVVGTLSLRASVDRPVWIFVVVIAYVIAFSLLGLALAAGFPVGVAYGIWGAVGVALTALLGAVLFDEFLSATTILGITVIIAGVVVVQSGVEA